MLQTSGAAYGAWSILDALLTPTGTGTPFIFREPLDPKDKDALLIGLLRLHIANLVGPLGHGELADALRRLTQQPFSRRLQGDITHARALLDVTPVGDVEKTSTMGGLVGGIVTRVGPIMDVTVDAADQ